MCTCLRKVEKSKIYPNNNRDPYKEEIKIPPPYPRKRKNINYFFPLEGSIFSLPEPILHGYHVKTVSD
jgi:hypothetical protein